MTTLTVPQKDEMQKINLIRNNNNLCKHPAAVTRKHRELLNGHQSCLVWLTGLPVSGKSTIAHAVEEKLYQVNCRTIVLDGDNIRHNLCGDLGFSKKDRTENIRRIAEVAKLFVEAGMIVLTAFISPFKTDREWVRGLFTRGDDFLEIYCNCPLEICEQRDVKGHYRRARAGEIQEFTGISSPYEEPEAPDMILNTHITQIDSCVEKVIALLRRRVIIKEIRPKNR